MEDGEKKSIDPKLALIIQQTEESIGKMEKSLGPDHIVVAQMLDTYAKLLRQHNYRVIDAVNLEARAKKIRAKHNQEEADAQAKKLGSTASGAQIGMSATKIKVVVWTLALVLAGTLMFTATQTMKSVQPAVTKLKLRELKARKEAMRTEEREQNSEPAPASSPTTVVTQPELPMPVVPSTPQMSEEEKEALDKRRAEIEKEQGTVREEIGNLVTHGQEFEAAGNSNDAIEAYQTAINAGIQAPRSIDGNPFVCEDMETAFERLIAIMEARGDTSAVPSMKRQLQFLRKALGKGE